MKELFFFLPYRSGIIMTYFSSLRRFFLISTAFLALTACDDNGQDEQTSPASEKSDGIDIPKYLLTPPSDTPYPTLAGFYLMGEFAQNRGDWETASSAFAKVLDVAPHTPDIQRRIMALDVGSGQIDKALKTAEHLMKEQTARPKNTPKNPEDTLAYLLLSLSHFKKNNFADAAKTIAGIEADGLGLAIIPIVNAWAKAGEGKVAIDGLMNSSPSLLYQTVLIAAYTKDKALLSDLAKRFDFTQIPITINRLEDVAGVFATMGEKDEAISIYTALKNAVPERAQAIGEKIKMIESGNISLPPPAILSSPQAGLTEAFYDMARLLSGGYQDSAQLFAQMAMFLTPNHKDTLELLAQIAASNELYTKAVTFLTRIDTNNNTTETIRIERQIAELTALSGDIDEAVRVLTKLVDTHDNIDAQIQIGDLYRSKERYAESLRAYNKAYDMLDGGLKANHWGLSFARGMVHERLKNWELAEKDLKTALSFQPDDPYILNYLAYSWADHGVNLDKAADMLEKAVRLKPDDGAVVDSLGWVYFRMGLFDKAVTLLEQAVQLEPVESEINDHLGDAYWRVDRKSEAVYQWKRAINFSKDNDFIKTVQDKIDNGLPPLPDGFKPMTTPEIIAPATMVDKAE